MQFLNEEIAFLTKKKKTESLVRKEHSCGIFQDYPDQKTKTGEEDAY